MNDLAPAVSISINGYIVPAESLEIVQDETRILYKFEVHPVALRELIAAYKPERSCP
jgi:hypothetical protein